MKERVYTEEASWPGSTLKEWTDALHNLEIRIEKKNGMILTPQQMAESALKTLDDIVADIYPPEERGEAKARILNAWSAEMFQAREGK